jgi:putative NADH-flavin reductase
MKIFVIGATGATGQQLVEQGLTQGQEITALVRNPDKFEMQHESLHVVKGDILVGVASPLENLASLAEVQQQDAVISSLGTRQIGLEPVTLLSEGTKNLVRVMELSLGNLLTIAICTRHH